MFGRRFDSFPFRSSSAARLRVRSLIAAGDHGELIHQGANVAGVKRARAGVGFIRQFGPQQIFHQYAQVVGHQAELPANVQTVRLESANRLVARQIRRTFKTIPRLRDGAPCRRRRQWPRLRSAPGTAQPAAGSGTRHRARDPRPRAARGHWPRRPAPTRCARGS